MSTDKDRQLRPNLVLMARRERRGWTSRRRAARELHKIWQEHLPGAPDLESLEKSLYRHETGRVQVRDEAYRRLYCLAYNASPHELFGSMEEDRSRESGRDFVIRPHKLVCAFVGAEGASIIAERLGMRPAEGQWLDCHAGAVPTSDGSCDVYVWPFGTVIFHLTEDLVLPSLAAFAVWRQRSYLENLAWATERLGELLPGAPEASYVFGAHWLREPAWTGETLETALRILCTPKVLLERDVSPEEALAHAELVEQALLTDGYDHAEIVPFGVKGISSGYAAWPGVVYYPSAEQRALAESELIVYEMATQALWTYSDHINLEIEQGRDPIVPDAYGWRFLRGMRSRLTNPRSQEIGQHRLMRSAVLETCGVVHKLDQAIETLRETGGG